MHLILISVPCFVAEIRRRDHLYSFCFGKNARLDYEARDNQGRQKRGGNRTYWTRSLKRKITSRRLCLQTSRQSASSMRDKQERLFLHKERLELEENDRIAARLP